MSDDFRVAAVQMDIQLGAPESNLAAMRDRLDQAVQNGAKLVVFPECALTGYCFESLEEGSTYGQPVPGPATEQVTEWCRQYDCYVIFGMLEADGESLFNAAVLVGPEGVIGNYRKAHLPFLGIDRFTTPGDRPFAVYDIPGLRVGMNICYDCSFPEGARIMALAGADLIALPTNWPPGAIRTATYMINTRAIENNVFYMAVDRCGTERGFSFIGMSRICAPNGDDLAFADHANEEIMYADLEVGRARNKHIVCIPEEHEIHRFNDRRPDLYHGLANEESPAGRIE